MGRTPLYCIILFLYIYIALLAVHTNQKRFQCERPREKRAVLRDRKEALGSPVNKVDRVYRRKELVGLPSSIPISTSSSFPHSFYSSGIECQDCQYRYMN